MTTNLPCRTDPELFMAPDGQRAGTGPYERRVAKAKALCAACPVRIAYREEGRRLRALGVWGGEDDVERTKTGRKPVKARVPAQCGTEAGDKAHRRKGETPCVRCSEAASAAWQRRKAVREPAECGTRRGYQRHRRQGEQACDPCRAANAAADRRLHQTGTTIPTAA